MHVDTNTIIVMHHFASFPSYFSHELVSSQLKAFSNPEHILLHKASLTLE